MLRLALLPLLLGAALVGAAERAPMPVAKDAGPITFDAIVGAALADARALPSDVAARTRYLCAANYATDAEMLAKVRAVVGGYQLNSLSREPDFAKVRPVNDWLWALDTADYGKDFAAGWERFENDNPYFLLKVQQSATVTQPVKKTVVDKVKKHRQVYRADAYGRGYYVTEEYTEDVPREVVEPVAEAGTLKETFVGAPWLPAAEAAALTLLTGSKTPIVFADQFFERTAVQKGRAGNGYLDFLGLQKTKTVKDLDDLIRFRGADAVAARREVYALVMKSGVARFPRQIDRQPASTGARWRTGDVDDPKGDGNALDRLFEDFKPKAREYVATLPNGLPVTFLADGQDKSQDAAPTNIVGNHKSLDNELEIDVGTVDCFLCHRGALAKVRDYGRKVFADRTGIKLAVVEPEKRKRAEYAYLTEDFDDEFGEDQKRFDRKYKRATGLDTKDLVEAVSDVWRASRVEAVTAKRAAARAGVTVTALRARLGAHFRGKGAARIPGDAVLVNFLLDDEDAEPVPMELFEERFPVLMLIIGGANP